jgi:hypothetical protein
MKYEPAKYMRFERDPIGCFEAHMMADGWAETKYVNDTSSVLLSVEVSEFIRLIHHFFKECDNWQKLQKYAKKYGRTIKTDDYDTVSAFNFIGDVMDYTFKLTGTTLNVFPYRKYKH